MLSPFINNKEIKAIASIYFNSGDQGVLDSLREKGLISEDKYHWTIAYYHLLKCSFLKGNLSKIMKSLLGVN